MYAKMPPTIVEVAEHDGSWPKLWDTVLHLGTPRIIGLQALSWLMAHLGH